MKTNNGKLIAAIMAMAMIVCAIAIVMPSSDAAVDNTIQQAPGDAVEIDDITKITGAGDYVIKAPTDDKTKTITVESNFTIPAGATLYIGEKYIDYIGTEDGKIDFIINEGVTLTIAGTVYNNSGDNSKTSAIVNNGTISFTGEGALYSTSAVNKISTGSMMNTFFTSTGETYQNYKHVYSADINTVIPYVMDKHYGDMESGKTAKAIYTYGNVSIASIADGNNISEIKLNVGGVGDSASTLTIPDEVNLVFSDVTIKEDSLANLYGTLTGTNGVTNNGKVNILSSEASLTSETGTISGSGSIDTSAIMKDATLSGDLETSTPFGPNQTVTVTNNLNLLKNTILTIEGKLIIPEGVTVTIQDGAQLIIEGQTATVENDGTVTVQATDGLQITGGTFTNNGTISAQYLPTGTVNNNNDDPAVIELSADAKLDNNGTVTIGADSGIVLNGTFTNKSGSVFTMTGTMSGNIDNAGTVDFNGRAATNVYINLISADAVANLTAVVSGDKSVFVTDDGYKSSTKTEFKNVDDVNAIILKGQNGAAGGIVVKAVTYTVPNTETGKDETYKGLDVSGTLTATVASGTADYTTSVLRIAGDDIFVNDSLSIGAGVELKLGNTSDSLGKNKITVNGTLNITADGNATPNSGNAAFKLTVDEETSFAVGGTIDSLTMLHNNGSIKMNAAMYTTVASAITTYHYTTLGNAVNAVADATTKVVDIYGNIEVDETVDIPSGMTVRMNQTSSMTIGTDGDVSVADGGVLATNGQKIIVNGSLYAETARTGITGIVTSGTPSIEAEVYSTNGTDALYTNLVDAMAAAESGDTIQLYSKGVELKNTSFVIKEGVIVDTNKQSFKVEGSTLTIDGTLFINDSEYTVQKLQGVDYEQKSTIILNGYIKNTDSMYSVATTDGYPAGAYYEISENGVPYYYITTVANAAPIIGTTDDDTVTIYGKVAMGNASFAGIEDYLSHVIIASGAEITSGDVTLDYADLTVQNGAQFTGSVTNGEGTVEVKMVNKTENSITTSPGTATFTADYNTDGVNVLTVAGAANLAEMTFTGNVAAGTMTVDKLTVDGTATFNGTARVITTLSVNGTVNVIAGQLSVDTDGDSFINGSIDAAVPSAESNNSGQASLSDMYVGISKDDKGNLIVGTAGTVTGNVSATVAYVSTDSTVPEAMTSDDMLSTEFYVNDELWMTAYTANESNKADVSNAPVTDAEFLGWNNADGDLVYYTGESKPADAATNAGKVSEIIIGSYDGKLYANVNYNVYDVIIRTDGGIKSVAIDGNVLAQYGNEFSADGLTSGEHIVSYTLKNGYQGEATLTADGITISGMTFTLSGDYSKEIYLNLAGTEPSNGATVIDNGDDGLGLTDYLLIILVVLIVIMAIMVAMRLMRS